MYLTTKKIQSVVKCRVLFKYTKILNSYHMFADNVHKYSYVRVKFDRVALFHAIICRMKIGLCVFFICIYFTIYIVVLFLFFILLLLHNTFIHTHTQSHTTKSKKVQSQIHFLSG